MDRRTFTKALAALAAFPTALLAKASPPLIYDKFVKDLRDAGVEPWRQYTRELIALIDEQAKLFGQLWNLFARTQTDEERLRWEATADLLVRMSFRNWERLFHKFPEQMPPVRPRQPSLDSTLICTPRFVKDIDEMTPEQFGSTMAHALRELCREYLRQPTPRVIHPADEPKMWLTRLPFQVEFCVWLHVIPVLTVEEQEQLLRRGG